MHSATLNKKPCAFHVISTRHPLHHRTIMRMTDPYQNLAMVLIIISRDNVIGRASVPLDDNRQLTAKDLSDEFCRQFDGQIIHNGTRSEASVSDFQLKNRKINEENLKEVFGRIENLFSN